MTVCRGKTRRGEAFAGFRQESRRPQILLHSGGQLASACLSSKIDEIDRAPQFQS